MTGNGVGGSWTERPVQGRTGSAAPQPNEPVQRALESLRLVARREAGPVQQPAFFAVCNQHRLGALQMLQVLDALQREGMLARGADAPSRGAHSSDPVAGFFAAARAAPALTAEGEAELARAVQLGRQARAAAKEQRITAEQARPLIEQGEGAIQALVAANLRLVAGVVRRGRHRYGDLAADLLQEGVLALHHAAESFVTGKHRFPRVARPRVHQALQRYLSRNGRALRVPSDVCRILRALSLARVRLAGAGKLWPGHQTTPLARELGLAEATVARLLLLEPGALSLDQELGEDGEVLGAMLPCSRDDLQHTIEDRDLAETLRSCVARLRPREQAVLKLRFGLCGEGPLTLDQAGLRLRITRERARQLVIRALEHLRESSQVRRLEVLLGDKLATSGAIGGESRGAARPARVIAVRSASEGAA